MGLLLESKGGATIRSRVGLLLGVGVGLLLESKGGATIRESKGGVTMRE